MKIRITKGPNTDRNINLVYDMLIKMLERDSEKKKEA